MIHDLNHKAAIWALWLVIEDPLINVRNILLHRYQDLMTIFNQTFQSTYNTQLVKGGDEPLYLPASDEANRSHHQIIFARGFYASALHEIAHWLVAGSQRRLLEDFGYWYCPDGRDQDTQLSFEKVEVKPQAIEWALSIACGFKFNVSSDNLDGWQSDRAAFEQKVQQQALQLLANGFNTRTTLLLDALRSFYHTPSLNISDFKFPELQVAL